MKKCLLLGLSLLCVLVLSCFTMLLTVPVMGASSDAEILSYSWYTVTFNDEAKTVREIVVIGELQNVGTSNIIYAYVIGSAFIDETKVAYISQEAYGLNIQPGEKAPFRLVFTAQHIIEEDLTDLTGVTDIDVNVGYVAKNDHKVSIDSPVSSKKESGSSPYTVAGTVTINVEELLDNKEWIDSFRVIATFYNSKGTAVSFGYTGLLGRGVESETGDPIDINFKVQPIDNHFGNEISDYEIRIQYNIRQTGSHTPAPSQSTPSTSSSPTATPTETPEGDKPKLDNTWIIIAVLIIAIITIPTILLLTQKKHNQPN